NRGARDQNDRHQLPLNRQILEQHTDYLPGEAISAALRSLELIVIPLAFRESRLTFNCILLFRLMKRTMPPLESKISISLTVSVNRPRRTPMMWSRFFSSESAM